MKRAYIGLEGSGKSASMIWDSRIFLREGIDVISNIKFEYNYKGQILKPIYVETSEEFIEKMLETKNALVLIDEMPLVFSSYDWNKMDKRILSKLSQGRKEHLDLFYTSQGFNHSLKRLRDLTNEVVKCTKVRLGGIREEFASMKRKGVVLWITNTIFNPEYFDRYTQLADLEKQYTLAKKRIFIWNLNKLYKMYDTESKVNEYIISPKI